eukprot:snap_masked-scaffold_99-processed-gene-0.13-mRNA-1 protein AED:1.00 eAED:1.00 QI:0/0/0/0/1/1/7/0/128
MENETIENQFFMRPKLDYFIINGYKKEIKTFQHELKDFADNLDFSCEVRNLKNRYSTRKYIEEKYLSKLFMVIFCLERINKFILLDCEIHGSDKIGSFWRQLKNIVHLELYRNKFSKIQLKEFFQEVV